MRLRDSDHCYSIALLTVQKQRRMTKWLNRGPSSYAIQLKGEALNCLNPLRRQQWRLQLMPGVHWLHQRVLLDPKQTSERINYAMNFVFMENHDNTDNWSSDFNVTLSQIAYTTQLKRIYWFQKSVVSSQWRKQSVTKLHSNCWFKALLTTVGTHLVRKWLHCLEQTLPSSPGHASPHGANPTWSSLV